jgi:hypothetical protein
MKSPHYRSKIFHREISPIIIVDININSPFFGLGMVEYPFRIIFNGFKTDYFLPIFPGICGKFGFFQEILVSIDTFTSNDTSIPSIEREMVTV